MQHGHVLKKLNLDLLNPPPRVGGGGGIQENDWLPCCFMCHSLSFDMQHDHILKKRFNFDLCPLLSPPRGVVGGGADPGLRT